MAKTEVYSWRVSAAVKRSLEDEARRRKLSLAELIDEIARSWLATRAGDGGASDRMRAEARRWIGSISGGGARRSERVRELVRARLQERHGRQRAR